MLRTWLGRLERSWREEPWLWGVMGLALALALPAIGYGLPLMLVDDEPPFTLAALKMLELHTLVPAFHLEAFRTVLYYPPYLSYLYLPFFALIVGVAYLLHGSAGLASYLASDLTPFFIAARLVTVAFGLLAIYLTYRIAERLFASRVAALAASFLLATSLLEIALSVVGRQWMPVSCVLLFVLYVLTDERQSERRRYLYAMLVAGFGMGFGSVSGLALPMIAFWWWCVGRATFSELLRDASLWAGFVGFLALAALPSLLYPGSSGFLVDITIGEPKSLVGLFSAPWHALTLTLYSEPVLMFLAVLGGVALLHRSRLRLFFVWWMAVYAVIFYLVFRFEARFVLPLIPLYALLGGYAVERMRAWHFGTVAACALLVLPLVASIRLAELGASGDTRSLARAWALEHLSASDAILVYAPLTRVPTTASAVAELREVDPDAVRRVDEADEALDRREFPHALNIFDVKNGMFFETLSDYARVHGYHYLLLDPVYAFVARPHAVAFAPLIEHATVLESWHGRDGDASLTASEFRAPFWRLFSRAALGPDVILYRLD